MSYPINYPRPQGANIQILYQTDDWVKPQGASFVWFTLIGAGGGGSGPNGGGGGSGAVTNCMVPAFLIPDVLRVVVGRGGAGGGSATNGSAGTSTNILYQQKDGTGYTLLTANAGSGGPTSGSGGSGASASTSNFFSCAGFFQSVAGQNGGSTSANLSASTTTFLSGGGGTTKTMAANYGYSPVNFGGDGFFMVQPIILGCGGNGGETSPAVNNGGFGGIGCGGGGGRNASPGGNGGDGLVVIITW